MQEEYELSAKHLFVQNFDNSYEKRVNVKHGTYL